MSVVPEETLPETELLSGLKKNLYERTRHLDPSRTLELLQHLKEWVADEVAFEEAATASFGRLISELSFSHFVDQLPPLINSFDRLVSAYFVRRGSVPGFHSFCNVWRERLIRRILLLAEEGLELNDYGRPPAPYALLACGTAGRREQTLEEASRYFLVWGGDAPDYFNDFAYRNLAILQQCSLVGKDAADLWGKVLWRGSLQRWESWLAGTDSTALDPPFRRLELVSDLRPVAGDDSVALEVLRLSRDALKKARGTADYEAMAQRAVSADVALTMAGALRVERAGEHPGCFNLIASATRPLVTLVRYLALEHDVGTASTAERIEALGALRVLDEGMVQLLGDLDDLLATLKIRKEIALQQPYVDPAELTDLERQRLRAGLEAVRRQQRMTRRAQSAL